MKVLRHGQPLWPRTSSCRFGPVAACNRYSPGCSPLGTPPRVILANTRGRWLTGPSITSNASCAEVPVVDRVNRRDQVAGEPVSASGVRYTVSGGLGGRRQESGGAWRVGRPLTQIRAAARLIRRPRSVSWSGPPGGARAQAPVQTASISERGRLRSALAREISPKSGATLGTGRRVRWAPHSDKREVNRISRSAS